MKTKPTQGIIHDYINFMHLQYSADFQLMRKVELTRAITLCPPLCQCNKLTNTNRFPRCRLLAVGSKPAYTHCGLAFRRSVTSLLETKFALTRNKHKQGT